MTEVKGLMIDFCDLEYMLKDIIENKHYESKYFNNDLKEKIITQTLNKLNNDFDYKLEEIEYEINEDYCGNLDVIYRIKFINEKNNEYILKTLSAIEMFRYCFDIIQIDPQYAKIYLLSKYC